MTYNNPTPVSVGIIPSRTPDHLILVERSDGGLALPGGYVDALEDTASAISREVAEETGIALDAGKWRLFFSAVTPDNKLLLFSYYAEAVALPKETRPNDEVTRVILAPHDSSLKFPLHEEAVRRWRSTMNA